MKDLVLIGMSGAGKSTVGVILAKTLGMSFVDTDIIIQQREGRLLQEIIDQDGPERFLEIEERALIELEASNSVIATGGSAVYSEKAMRHLEEIGAIVYLHAKLNEILHRVGNMTSRGIVLLNGNTLEDAYMERLPLYRRYARITVESVGADVESIVKDIIEKVSVL